MASSSSSSRFIRLERLGEGTYGVVYRARERSTGAIVAYKRITTANEDEGVPATAIREICLLKELRHANIVALRDVMIQHPKLVLILEYCDYDLKKYMDLRQNKRLDAQTEVPVFLKQMLLGLNYMHQRSVVHRDLKPQNILVNSNKVVKLGDFGLARVEGIPVKKYSHEAVTLWYRSPDVILGSVMYGLAVDMWSMGCIFAEMVTGTALFTGGDDAEQLLQMLQLFGSQSQRSWRSMMTYPNSHQMFGSPDSPLNRYFDSRFDVYARRTGLDRLGPEGLHLLRAMLQFEPSDRISAAEALQHPFLADVEVPVETMAEAVASKLALIQEFLPDIRTTHLDAANAQTVAERT